MSQPTKVIVNIIYPCYICANDYVSPQQVINHVKREHGYILKARSPGHRRPADGFYAYENGRNRPWQVQHFGCPSCWYHTPKVNHIEQLMKHIMEEHKPDRIEGFINPDKEENELEDSEEEVLEDEVKVEEIKINDLSEEEKGQIEVAQAIKQRLDDISAMFKTLFND